MNKLNRNETLKEVEEFYDELNHSDAQPQIEERTGVTGTPRVTKDQVKEVL